jgi:hypothetical protein
MFFFADLVIFVGKLAVSKVGRTKSLIVATLFGLGHR